MRARWVFLGIAGAAALAITGAIGARSLQTQTGPFSSRIIAQPIAFPHDLHAGTNGIPCMYCHYSADRSVDAGIPALTTCTGCHMPAGALLFRQDSPELAKLVAYWEARQPIPWARIHKVADHAHFPHMRHVNAGLECQECHGPVETMRDVVQWSSLRMGWCLECHNQRQVRIDCAVCHY
jgi:hypothetical protein